MSRELKLARALFLLVVIAAPGCAGSGSDDNNQGGGGGNGGGACTPPASASVSYDQNVSPILVSRCAYAGCHVSPNPPNGLNLEAGVSYAAIVNVAADQRPAQDLVTPGDVNASYLWLKIAAAQGIAGGPMPVGCPGIPPAGGCLTDMQTAAINQWIVECAQDN